MTGTARPPADTGNAHEPTTAAASTAVSATAAPIPGSAGWWKQRYLVRSRQRPRPGGLTLAAITGAALQITDREGLDALTMRRLADSLDVRHTSLYRHVASREELLVEMVDHMLGEVRLPQPDPGWRAGTEAGAHEYRRVLHEHPAVVPLMTTGQLLGPNALRAREQGLSVLSLAGWPPRRAVQIYLTVTHFVVGTAIWETSGAARTTEQRAAMSDLFASLPSGRLPTLSAHAALLGAPDGDEEFDFGLRCLLDGIARTWDLP
ncbi:TetR/AcrR family transcriptional regulator [Streptacidiphilus rugosus]|uniref:TetR/AcrR family transcriptional regulator n=1 Tax=Streptacidiphilus rugosus TaxID=405783 RepID=UPI0006909C1D|nr:TetR/AcrR family transcriptional regulator [Streptacidiphilus rugosus]